MHSCTAKPNCLPCEIKRSFTCGISQGPPFLGVLVSRRSPYPGMRPRVSFLRAPSWNGYLSVEEVQNSEMETSAKEAFMELIEAEGISATKNKYPCN